MKIGMEDNFIYFNVGMANNAILTKDLFRLPYLQIDSFLSINLDTRILIKEITYKKMSKKV